LPQLKEPFRSMMRSIWQLIRRKRLVNTKTSKARRVRPCARSFLGSIQELLTPAIWKQAEAARSGSRCPRSSRWSTQPLVLCLLFMTWCGGDSQAERFETAKAMTAVCLVKRRRPGKTVQGFHKALKRLPTAVLRGIAAGVRRRLLETLDLCCDGFIAFGCDGSSLICPRTEELEKRLDASVKGEAGTPQVWVTALVHLRTGLLWAWRLGKGHNRERSHLRAMLPMLSALSSLPTRALLVADAGFNGYELSQALTEAGISYVIRMSGKDRLYTMSETPLTRESKSKSKSKSKTSTFVSGEVLLWPTAARQAKLPPQRVRLWCIRSRKKKQDVWLLTNVLDAKRLTREMVGRYYRQRWENEGLFRTYKQTLKKVKLTSRTVRLAHREAEGSLLATQVLLAMGAFALVGGRGTKSTKSTVREGNGSRESSETHSSPRKLLLTIRKLTVDAKSFRDDAFGRSLGKALQEQRPRRTSLKEKRVWPSRAPHTKPKPPKCLKLTDDDKALANQYLAAASYTTKNRH
jgi:hypothetical protein